MLLTTVTPVAAAPPMVTAAPDMKPVPVMVTAVPPFAVPVFGEIALTFGAGLLEPPLVPLARKATICITQLLELFGAVALKLPVVLTVLSSAMSASGVVMMRETNPVPAPVKWAMVIPAPKIKSFADVVVAAPLLALVPLPAAPAFTSSGLAGSSPLYSSARISTYLAAWLNLTVIVLLPALMPAA